MKAITLRGIDNEIYDLIKSKSKDLRISMNKFILKCIKKAVLRSQVTVYNDLDDFFGSWDKKTYRDVKKAIKKQRKIDKELWK